MPILTSQISFPSDGHETPAYLARPVSDRLPAAVVVIQEWWGLVPHIKNVADRFAKEGYVALAPDLYYGESAEEPDQARKLAMALDRKRAVLEISAAAQYLLGLDGVRIKTVGVVGWCMGGGLALSAAAENDDLAASVCFYGRPLAAEDTARLNVPVLGHFGSEDHGIPLDDVRAFEAELEKIDVPHAIHIYDGAHHAFFNDERAAYHPEAAALAWQRTLAWFRQYLLVDVMDQT